MIFSPKFMLALIVSPAFLCGVSTAAPEEVSAVAVVQGVKELGPRELMGKMMTMKSMIKGMSMQEPIMKPPTMQPTKKPVTMSPATMSPTRSPVTPSDTCRFDSCAGPPGQACGPNFSCYCTTNQEKKPVCIDPTIPCATTTPCTASSQCTADETCIQSDCCSGQGYCFIVCK
jgi:hypothetical protein